MGLSTSQGLIEFLSSCPSSWHATNLAQKKLLEAGFIELRLSEQWRLQEGGRYLCRLNTGAMIAFIAKMQSNQLALLGCHTESPCLRVKANGFIQEDGVWMAHVEPYGSPILASWFFKDLGVCAQLLVDTPIGPVEKWVTIEEPIGILESPSIHLDRDLNQKGFAIDKQKHLKVLLGSKGSEHPLKSLLEEAAGGTILSHEIMLFALEKASFLHLDKEWIASWRIDNLASCAACVDALIGVQETNSFCTAVFANHEEIGSQTYSGAQSSNYLYLIRKAFEACSIPENRQLQMIHEGLFCSIDNAHGLHPCYSELFEPSHKPKLGLGPVVKYHPGGKYCTDAQSAARVQWLAKASNIPTQSFHIRADLTCGSTIGPLLSTALGIPGVDIGIPQLAMHATREVMHAKDYAYLVNLLKAFLTKLPKVQGAQL